MLALFLTAVAIYRLPVPETGLLMTQGPKVVLGGMMGAFIVAGLAFVAPKLGPTETFVLYFFVIAATSTDHSSTASAFSEQIQSRWRLDRLPACCSPVSASCSFARERPPLTRGRQDFAVRQSLLVDRTSILPLD